jgi:hypothetical protein
MKVKMGLVTVRKTDKMAKTSTSGGFLYKRTNLLVYFISKWGSCLLNLE